MTKVFKTNNFKSKIKICESEASETQYWLEIIVEVYALYFIGQAFHGVNFSSLLTLDTLARFSIT